jgi:hypothetical protein
MKPATLSTNQIATKRPTVFTPPAVSSLIPLVPSMPSREFPLLLLLLEAGFDPATLDVILSSLAASTKDSCHLIDQLGKENAAAILDTEAIIKTHFSHDVCILARRLNELCVGSTHAQEVNYLVRLNTR